jgi:hypothetical protein
MNRPMKISGFLFGSLIGPGTAERRPYHTAIDCRSASIGIALPSFGQHSLPFLHSAMTR